MANRPVVLLIVPAFCKLIPPTYHLFHNFIFTHIALVADDCMRSGPKPLDRGLVGGGGGVSGGVWPGALSGPCVPGREWPGVCVFGGGGGLMWWPCGVWGARWGWGLVCCPPVDRDEWWIWTFCPLGPHGPGTEHWHAHG